MSKELTSKFNLIGVKCRIVEGIMTDKKTLEEMDKRIREATEEKFREYDLARYKAWVLAKEKYLD